MFEKKDAVNETAAVNPQLAPVVDAFKAKKNAASKKMMERKKAAIKQLADLAARLGSPEEKASAAYLMGTGPRTHVAGTSGVSILKTLFNEEVGKSIGEGEVFKLTKMGRTEMRAQIKKLVQQDQYVSFDPVAETYTYNGKEKPANWTGPNKAAPKVA